MSRCKEPGRAARWEGTGPKNLNYGLVLAYAHFILTQSGDAITRGHIEGAR